MSGDTSNQQGSGKRGLTTPVLTTSGQPRMPNVPALGIPITAHETHKKSGMFYVITVLLVLVVAIAVVSSVYYSQHDKVVNLTQSVQSANAKIKPLEDKIQTLNNSLASTEPNVANNKNVLQLPSLGIEITLPNNLADITTSANSNGTVVNMSTQTLSQLDPGCTASFTNGNALGDFSIVTGSFKNTSKSTLIQQNASSFIAYTPPVSSCSSVSVVNNLNNSLLATLKQSFSSVQTLAK